MGIARRHSAFFALAAAGLLWGLSVPLSKLALGWLSPAWLTVARFAIAAPPLALAGRRRLRSALDLRVAGSGAIGFGAVILLQNAGIERTSVSHAAVLVGAVPVLVALIAAAHGPAAPRASAWAGYAVALAGIALVAGAGGRGATIGGDALVLASATLSAAFIATQPRLLAGRDPVAVTAVQFGAGALAALPIALAAGPPPTWSVGAPGVGALLALLALCVAGTILPFPLFAFGQARVTAEIAGAFVNLEPVVGAAVGWVAFGEGASAGQLCGALAVLVGIVLSSLPAPAPVPAPSPASGAFGALWRVAVRGCDRAPGAWRSEDLTGAPGSVAGHEAHRGERRRCRVVSPLPGRSRAAVPPDGGAPSRGLGHPRVPLETGRAGASGRPGAGAPGARGVARAARGSRWADGPRRRPRA